MTTKLLLMAAVVACLAALAGARVQDEYVCKPIECPFMLRVKGSELADGDKDVLIAPGTVKLRGLDVDNGLIAGGWKADGVSVDKIIIASSVEWSEKVFTYSEDEELEDVAPLQTLDGSPIEYLDICYHFHLVVEKDADACYERRFEWTIDVTTPVTEVVELARNQPYDAPFKYTMTRASHLEDFDLKGTVVIRNPDPKNAVEITSIVDTYDGAAIAVTCPQALPFVLQPSAEVTCEYKHFIATLPAGQLPPGSNKVDVGVKAGSVVGGRMGTEVTFEWKECEVTDECVNEEKMKDGSALGANCDETFVPERDVFEPFKSSECGTFDIPYDAYLVGADTQTKWYTDGQAVVRVHIDCPCVTGCVLTHGYWKTHSSFGPSKYDDRWMNILPLGDRTPFFGRGDLNYYQAISGEENGGVYFKLAAQYVAAKLNILGGASTTVQVEQAVNFAEAYFRGAQADDAKVIAAADLLDKYNNGALDRVDLPPHCDF